MVNELENSREVAEYYANDHWLDNYMIREQPCADIYQHFRFKPDLDICSDPFGSNSLCERFYSPQ